jgi:hypothetical protein
MLVGINASHLSVLIAEVRDEEERLNYASKDSLLALADYMTRHRVCVHYSVEEMEEATKVLQRHHLAHLLKWPEGIKEERRNLGPVFVHKAPSRRARGKRARPSDLRVNKL